MKLKRLFLGAISYTNRVRMNPSGKGRSCICTIIICFVIYSHYNCNTFQIQLSFLMPAAMHIVPYLTKSLCLGITSYVSYIIVCKKRIRSLLCLCDTFLLHILYKWFTHRNVKDIQIAWDLKYWSACLDIVFFSTQLYSLYVFALSCYLKIKIYMYCSWIQQRTPKACYELSTRIRR